MAGKKTIKSAIESMMFVWGEPLDIKEAAEVFNMDKKEIYPYFKELQEEGNLPTALFVANDSMAAGCYKAAYESGLKIPEDISIIGFNDIPTAKYMIPPLTTVRVYMEFMGEYAVHMLEERVFGERELCLKMTAPTKLYVRDSVKDIR